jgi:hypothetical protein
MKLKEREREVISMWKVKDKVHTGKWTVQELRRKDERNRELG